MPAVGGPLTTAGIRTFASPVFTTSAGTTKIFLPRPGVITSGRPARASKDGETHGASNFGAVFVNDIGRAPMFSKEKMKFPVGSMIVREKLTTSPAMSNISTQTGSTPITPANEPSAKEPPPARILNKIEDFGPPQILVVMLKREKGFNPKANDWEFLTVSGDGKRIEKRRKEGACLACHKSKAKNDFVFREGVR